MHGVQTSLKDVWTPHQISTERPQTESLEERCRQLQQDLAETELRRTSAVYDDFVTDVIVTASCLD